VPHTLLDRGAGRGKLTKTGVGYWDVVVDHAGSGDHSTVYQIGANGAYVALSGTSPAALAAGDVLEVTGTYEG
jgi:hypothetical protein